MGIKKVSLVIDKSVRTLCYRPYPLHPKGCPNYGKKETCPPKVELITELLDLSKPVYVVWNVFDLASHVERMKEAHPNWSQRQLHCCLYWQPKARKILRKEIEGLGLWLLGKRILFVPEACGVNVTATMASIGEILEWPPVTKTYQVAIVGEPSDI